MILLVRVERRASLPLGGGDSVWVVVGSSRGGGYEG